MGHGAEQHPLPTECPALSSSMPGGQKRELFLSKLWACTHRAESSHPGTELLTEGLLCCDPEIQHLLSRWSSTAINSFHLLFLFFSSAEKTQVISAGATARCVVQFTYLT